MILAIFIQLFSMLEGDVRASKGINLQPAAGLFSQSFNAVHQFMANSRFCLGALEFTFDLLHRVIQWSIFGAEKGSVII